MSDSANANVTSGPPRRRSFSERIAEKFSALKGRRTSHHSDHSQQSDQNQNKHQHGPNENARDSAFAVEGSVVGAHAIPPSVLNTVTRVKLLSKLTVVKRKHKRSPRLQLRPMLINSRPRVPLTLVILISTTITLRVKWILLTVLRAALVATTTDP